MNALPQLLVSLQRISLIKNHATGSAVLSENYCCGWDIVRLLPLNGGPAVNVAVLL